MNTIRIERVILDGIDLPRSEESRFRANLERELARLFTEQGSPVHSSSAIATVDGGVIQTTNASMATQVARSVYASLGGQS